MNLLGELYVGSTL